jgi:isoamylase
VTLTDQHSPIDHDRVSIGRRKEQAAVRAGVNEVADDQAGKSYPLGATVLGDGVNFSVFSREASRVDLLLFDDPAATHPAQVIELDPRTHRTYHYWHVFIPGIRPGQVYGYRAIGPFDPARGLRFDPSKALLDPYGRAVVVPDGYSRRKASQFGENDAIAMKSVVVDPDLYDWEGDVPLRRPFATTVIYEMDVGGFTRHPSSRVTAELRGTYAGMIEKIPYLQGLGITAVELLPIFQFDRQDCPPGLVNYWGYSPVSFLRLMPVTVSERTRSAQSMSSATSSRRCTAPASKSSLMSSTTTPRKETAKGQPYASGASQTKSITSSTLIARITRITAAPETR